MPAVAPTFVRIATVGELDADLKQNLPNPENQFLHHGCGTQWTVALRRLIFKQKKGYVTIGLGLNYCSMGSSHSPSCDTVPLTDYCFILFCGNRIPIQI
jgi:hypothetical protein